MVHSECECTHHTTGKNCERCFDFFNDAPWKPADAKHANECKRCNCNEHARSCHFDEAAYVASSNKSASVCDECMHNTQGKNCEQCKPQFFRAPGLSIDDWLTCRPCECDAAGSVDDNCDAATGQCKCRENFSGRQCNVTASST
ncbi:Laminin [Aphelenchoides fujianensis]|nr:Laminin [Aphelenchoides fujianensis]